MQIRYQKEVGVMMYFAQSEIRVALQILRAMYKLTQIDFIQEAIVGIEADMQPKRVQMVNHFHICEHCFMEIDDRDPNAYKMTTRDLKGEENSKWIHYVCKTLKDNRPE